MLTDDRPVETVGVKMTQVLTQQTALCGGGG
eukprot:COSAG02_NODE_45366_length_358_cov_0.374517_2_plen_30_part_01